MQDRPSRRRPAFGLLLAAMLVGGTAHAAEYRIKPGDTLEISVIGIADLRQRTTVNVDGEITVPLFGQLKVAGLPVSGVRTRVQEILSTKVLRQRTQDGRDYPVNIMPDEVNVSIAEYKPVYLAGDVMRPGEQAFRPGLTVRQMISNAGGTDIIARFRTGNPFYEAVDFKTEMDNLWTDYAREQARVWRLQTELGDTAGADATRRAISELSVPKATVDKILQLEEEQQRIRAQDLKNEADHIKRQIEQINDRIATLTQQRQKEQDGLDADNGDLARFKEAYDKGTLPFTRVAEARRATLLSSTGLLQTIAMISQGEREREDLQRRIQQTADQRRADTSRDLQEATVRLGNLKARIQAVTAKSALNKSITAPGAVDPLRRASITVIRRDNGPPLRIAADEDTELQPGDVVELTLPGPDNSNAGQL